MVTPLQLQIRRALRKPRLPGQDSGRWNEYKFKVFYILYLAGKEDGWLWHDYSSRPVINKVSRSAGRYYTVSDLSYITGVPKLSLWVLFPRWLRWGYVIKRRNALVNSYQITERGLRFLFWGLVYLPVKRFNRELMAWQQKRG